MRACVHMYTHAHVCARARVWCVVRVSHARAGGLGIQPLLFFLCCLAEKKKECIKYGANGPKTRDDEHVRARTDSNPIAQMLESRRRGKGRRPHGASTTERLASQSRMHINHRIEDFVVIGVCPTWALKSNDVFEPPSTSSPGRPESEHERLERINQVGHRQARSHQPPTPFPRCQSAGFLLFSLCFVGPGLVLGLLCLTRFGHLGGGWHNFT